MPTDNTSGNKDFLYEDLTYKINGIFIEIHKELGAYAREKQIGDLLEKKFKDRQIVYKREVRIGDSGNIVDFVVEGKIAIELKTQPFLITEHYDQIKRYLIQTNLKLGLLVNFRGHRVQIKRVLNPNNFK